MKMISINELSKLFFSQIENIERLSDNTIESYKRDIEKFLRFINDKKLLKIDELRERHIRLFLMELNSYELSRNSISRQLSTLRKFFNFCIINDYLENNPIENISNPKYKRKLPETLLVDSYEEIFRFIGGNYEVKESKRIKVIFELLYGCALRVSELCMLNNSNIDMIKKSIRVLGKGSKTRIVPIGEMSIPVIEDYNKAFNPNGEINPFLFDKKGERTNRQHIYHLVNKILSNVSDIKKKSPHVLRHAAATHMLDRDADLIAIKELLGHENLSTTQIYTHVSIEKLKKSYKKAHPKS
ncbi:MAG: tyrosine-type recombinase/integrase [Melioribacteraceae bacterium]|nr:tyrosine-type recombinase/integrase [Melioribacteraceae bacterium]